MRRFSPCWECYSPGCCNSAPGAARDVASRLGAGPMGLGGSYRILRRYDGAPGAPGGLRCPPFFTLSAFPRTFGGSGGARLVQVWRARLQRHNQQRRPGTPTRTEPPCATYPGFVRRKSLRLAPRPSVPVRTSPSSKISLSTSSKPQISGPSSASPICRTKCGSAQRL